MKTTNKFEAPMMLIGVLVKIDCNNYLLEHKMLHGLVYRGMVADQERLKKYCVGLVDQYITGHLRHAVDEDAHITWEFVEFGIVAPDDVSLPFAACNKVKAVMANMQMIVETNTQFPTEAGPPPAYPDIKVVE